MSSFSSIMQTRTDNNRLVTRGKTNCPLILTVMNQTISVDKVQMPNQLRTGRLKFLVSQLNLNYSKPRGGKKPTLSHEELAS